MYKLGSQTSQESGSLFLVCVVYVKKAFRSEELFGDDKAGSCRPGRLTGPPGLAGGQSPIAAGTQASSVGRCDYK